MYSIKILHLPELLFLKAITSLCLTGYLLYQWQGSKRRPHKSCVAKVGFLVLVTDQTEAATMAATIYSRTFSTKNLQKLQAISTFLFQSLDKMEIVNSFCIFLVENVLLRIVETAVAASVRSIAKIWPIFLSVPFFDLK